MLVEQYLDFAQELGDHFVVMDRGAIVYASDKASMDEARSSARWRFETRRNVRLVSGERA